MSISAQSQLSGSFSTPLDKVTYSNEFCLQSGCHLGGGVMPGATESSTKDYGFDPHSTYHGGVVQQCNSCHRMHDQSVLTRRESAVEKWTDTLQAGVSSLLRTIEPPADAAQNAQTAPAAQ